MLLIVDMIYELNVHTISSKILSRYNSKKTFMKPQWILKEKTISISTSELKCVKGLFVFWPFKWRWMFLINFLHNEKVSKYITVKVCYSERNCLWNNSSKVPYPASAFLAGCLQIITAHTY